MSDVSYCKDCTFWEINKTGVNGKCTHPIQNPELVGDFITGAFYWCYLFYTKSVAVQEKELALRGNLKTELLNQYGQRCETCGSQGDFRGIQMHHQKKLSQLGKTDKSNLILLCGVCHDREHGIVDK